MGRKINKALLEAGSIFLPLFAFYLWFQLKSIYGGDSGDLVSAALVGGIPHPPGYPLWTFLASLLVKLPLYTPAWRAGLLSSAPAAGTLTFLYFIIKKITRNRLAALTAILALTFNYVFWLYAEVAEVFSLNNLFVAGLIWLFLRIREVRELGEFKKIILAIFFLIGLSFSHHHIILFTFPGFIYLALKNQKILLKIWQKYWPVCILGFCLGLLPLIYLPLSAKTLPAVDWANPTTLENFGKLFSRDQYGTFRSTPSAPNEPLLRLFSLASLCYFFYKDFLVLGLILMILGFFYLWRAAKTYFLFILIEMISLAFFIYYASFSLANDFKVATFERFLLMPYLLVTILIGGGVIFILNSLGKLKPLGQYLILLYPLSVLIINYPKISILKNDLTAENYAQDILDSLPERSILLLTYDTPLFNTQYYYYAYRYRPDIKLIDITKLYQPYYPKILAKYYPDLVLPDQKTDKPIAEFIKKNETKFTVFSHGSTPNLETGFWLPRGLLLQYYPAAGSTPSAQTVRETNQKLWSSYHDPLLGSLKKFKNLFTASILYFYAEPHKQTARYFLDQGFLNEAQWHLETALNLNDKDTETYYYLGEVWLAKKQCQEAEKNFQKILSLDPGNLQALGFLRLTYLECFKDPSKAKEFEDSCVESGKDKEIKLKEL